MRGRKVLIQCSLAKMSNSATITTGKGMKIVAITTPNTKSRPGHLIREKPYAMRGLEMAAPIAVPPVRITELSRNVQNGMYVTALTKFAQSGAFGSRVGG